MIQDLLQWLGLLDLSDVVATKSASNVILALYLLSLKRSWRFALAFFVCETLGLLNFLGLFDSLSNDYFELSFYLSYIFIWLVMLKSQLNHTKNPSLALWCIIMILFTLFMAQDSYYNADIETFFDDHYTAIIVSIHGCLILSLYDIRGIFIGMARKLCNFVGNIRSTYFA